MGFAVDPRLHLRAADRSSPLWRSAAPRSRFSQGLPLAYPTLIPPGAPMPEATPMVFVVEDDSSVREALAGLIRSAGWNVEVYVSAQEFLARPVTDGPGCLVLDVG